MGDVPEAVAIVVQALFGAAFLVLLVGNVYFARRLAPRGSDALATFGRTA